MTIFELIFRGPKKAYKREFFKGAKKACNLGYLNKFLKHPIRPNNEDF